MAGVLAGIAAVLYAKFGTKLAFPWFALVGSSTVFAVGLAASYVVPAPSGKPAADRRSDRRGPGRRRSGASEGLQRRGLVLVDLDDVRQADGLGPDCGRPRACCRT